MRVCPSMFVISYLNWSGMANVYDWSVFNTTWTCNICMSMNYILYLFDIYIASINNDSHNIFA